jgi:hypothetical protein
VQLVGKPKQNATPDSQIVVDAVIGGLLVFMN